MKRHFLPSFCAATIPDQLLGIQKVNALKWFTIRWKCSVES